MSKSLKIKALHLFSLAKWLNQIPLAREQSRDRTRFTKMCEEVLTDVEKKRVELVKKHAKKDKSGEYIVKEDGQFDVPEKHLDSIKKEYGEILQEVLDVPTLGNKSKFQAVKEILETTSYEFSGSLAIEYDEWMISFEKLEL
jgi:hypothetical protein